MTAPTVAERGSSRNLVLFFPWLYASSGARAKYEDMYLRRGMDVLSVSCQLKQFLWPSYSRTVAHELLHFLSGNELPLNIERYFVHAVSIGAFVYTVMMMEMQANPGKFSMIQKRIVGQVYDSLTLGGFSRMTDGIANKSTGTLTKSLIKGSIHSYLYLTKKHTVHFYDASVTAFKSAMVRSPILILYSLDDPMCCSDDMEEMISNWKHLNDPNLEVHVKCWQQSNHAQHMRTHPEQYELALQAFLVRLGLEPGGV